jgi:hypothetical protein
MQLQNIRIQIAHLKAQLPPPLGKPVVIVLASKGHEPANESMADGFLRWFYRDEKELEELHAKFDREYGPETRSPHDAPCLFVRFTEASELREEQQLKGTP